MEDVSCNTCFPFLDVNMNSIFRNVLIQKQLTGFFHECSNFLVLLCLPDMYVGAFMPVFRRLLDIPKALWKLCQHMKKNDFHTLWWKQPAGIAYRFKSL